MNGRRLIVNADDFGMSDGVNEGVVRSIDEGIVRSASLMVRRPAAEAAAAAAAARPAVSLGLHLDLGEWRYEDGEWRLHDRVVDLEDPAAIEREVSAQLERFVGIVGIRPTHIDSHQHVHLSNPAKQVVIVLARRWDMPLRSMDERVAYCGSFYGQWGTGEPLPEAITVPALQELIRDLPQGITELGCHPGLDEELDSSYCKERLIEVATLCDPEVDAVLRGSGVELVTFAHIPPR